MTRPVRPWSWGALVVVSLLAACGGDGEKGPGDDTAADTRPEDLESPDVSETSEVEDAQTDVEADTAETDEPDGEVVGDASDAAETVDTGPSSTGFPAEGLLIRVTEPGAHGTAESISPVVMVSGLLFGNASSIVWQLGSQTGTATPATFWSAGPMTLVPGDNRITVSATDGAETVSDTVVVTYNPAFRFDEPLTARPGALWSNEEAEVVFTVSTTRYGNADTSSLRLVRVDASGGLLADQGAMRDDGKISSSGDEIEQDGVFTWTGRFTCTAAEPMYFRATVKVGSPSFNAVSPIVRVDCLERLRVAECTGKKVLIDAAGAALEGGATADSVLAQLRADPLVAQAGAAEDGSGALWVAFTDGVLGAVLLPRAELRGAAGLGELAATAALAEVPPLPVGSKRALVLSPQHASFGETDEGPALAANLVGSACPRYDVEGDKAWLDAEAGIERLRRVGDYGIVSIATHGAVLFGGLEEGLLRRLGWAHGGPQEVLWTGSALSCDSLLQAEQVCVVTSSDAQGGCPVGTRCLVTKGLASDDGASGQGVCVDETQIDLRRGRAVMTNRGLAVTPAFFSAWRGRGLPASLVHLGACSSMRNGSLASALYAAGARAISGFSGPVASAWAKDKALALFEAAAGGTVGSHHTSGADPSHGGVWRLFGAKNLTVDSAEIINGDFENGGLVGWRTSGDGRAVAKFGPAQPVSGKTMGLVSSGLGYSVETGTLEQTFCIPADTTRLSVYWKFMSEEFKEWCGNEKFQDRFAATLTDSAGNQVGVVTVAVDDLCGYGDGTCRDCPAPRACDAACAAEVGCYLDAGTGECGGQFNCQCGRDFVGLSASAIGFDQGGVYEVGWRQAKVDVSAFAGGGPVTLRLSVEDSGDSLFDTAVLVDAVLFE